MIRMLRDNAPEYEFEHDGIQKISGEDEFLLRAALAHIGRTKHHCRKYGNFVECETCGKHAHVALDTERNVLYLVDHDRERVIGRIENPEDF
jgi:hypothetical protein